MKGAFVEIEDAVSQGLEAPAKRSRALVIGRTLNVVANMANISAHTPEGVAAGEDEAHKRGGEEQEGEVCY
jgi:hypothetical protein